MLQLTPHQLEALNIRSSISLTANAGSGKTHVLARRYLEIIVNTSTSLHQIAAITFTDKAAGELYRKIAEELSRLREQEAGSELQKKIDRLRKKLVSANISTIHSFCVDLLKEYPVEASLDANFIPVDQRTAEELVELSTEHVLRKKLSEQEDDGDIKLLIRLLGSKTALARELGQIIQKRKNLLLIKEKIYNKSIPLVAESFKEIFRTRISQILKIELPVLIRELTAINNEVLLHNSKNETAIRTAELLGDLNRLTPENILKKLAELSNLILIKKGTIKSQGYLSGSSREKIYPSVFKVEKFFADFKDLVSAERPEGIEEELAKFGMALLNISMVVISEYENRKREMGYLDFEDILLKTREILAIEDVRNVISRKFKYLLVDEYQDTNEIQYEIFLPVVDDLKSGNLFIVGDEKQSIYRFRDAELEVFGNTSEDIRNASDENLVLTLPDSFRMAPSICLFTNYLFKKVFDNPQPLYNEVGHSELVCARDDSFNGKVEFLISDNEKDFSEAELVAGRILKLKNECKDEIPEWSKIAVLVRKRAAFTELEKTFVKFGIPFTVVGGTGFFQQQSISDIYNYFAFLFNVHDDSALIGTLRSPFFTVSDLQIFQLSLFPGSSFWEKLISAASSGEFWKQIHSAISENLNLAGRISIPDLLLKILNESDFIPVMNSRMNGEQESSNLDKLISITVKFFNQDFNSLYDYLTFLKNSIAHYAEEAQAGIESGSNCVNLMTIHQAKGLEFPAVFLYRCTDTVPSGNVKAKSFKIDKNFGLLTKVPVNENFFGNYFSAPIVDFYNFIESKKETAELKRLFYVGVTRAMNYLFISMTEAGRANRLNSFSDLVRTGLQPDFNKEFFTLEGELELLKKTNQAFSKIKRKMLVEIPIVKNIELPERAEKDTLKKTDEKNYLLDVLKDRSEGELISATKYSLFRNCPRKYNLKYNLKFSSLVEDYNLHKNFTLDMTGYEFNTGEQRKIAFEEVGSETFGYADIKGSIIHKVLKAGIPSAGLNTFIQKIIDNGISAIGGDLETINLMKTEIVDELNKFYSSDEYRLLNSHRQFKNEYEVYCNEEDYYLFGIIDKIIFTQNKIIIVDYKTDSKQHSEPDKRAEKYLPQLKFYSYIVRKLNRNIPQIEMRIVFIKNPASPVVKIFTENDENEVRAGIKIMISSIRNNNYSVNLDHCSECIFAVNRGNCILEGIS